MVLSPTQGSDLEFMQCVEVALLRIQSNPFAILYEVTPDEIEIIAVFIRDAIRMFGSHG